jgi:trimeric autotransporter adhesin
VTSIPTTTTAGAAQSITVIVRDAFGNLATGYAGTVQFTSSDPQAGLPANYTFSSNDGGTHTFIVILKTAGTQSITVADQAISGFTSTQSGINVVAAAAASFSVTGFPAATTAGVTQSFTVIVRDAFGNLAVGYTGAVRFSSNDTQAGLPANYTFTPGDAGVHTFTATLKTAGSRSITATDLADSSLTGTQAGINVTAAAATHFAISAPSTIQRQTNFSITVTALDAYGNIATGYRGRVKFTSSDRHANLPADYTFTANDSGVHTFTMSFKTIGLQSILVKDNANGTITGTTNVTVQ